MLCKDKTERYQSAEQLLTDLKQLPASVSANDTQPNATRTKEISAITTAESLPGRILNKAQLNKWAVLASALALILLGVVIARWLTTDHLDSLAILPFTYASSDPQLMANPDGPKRNCQKRF